MSLRAKLGLSLLLWCCWSAVQGQGLPSQTWPAGTQLASWNHGGRITTFHRGLLYLGGTDGQGTQVYNIANPQSPQLMCSSALSVNGHAWQKIGDLFYRQYWNPEVGADPPQGTSQFVSLAQPCNRVPWTQAIHNFPVQTRVWGGGFMDTYPNWYGDVIYDSRVGYWPPLAETSVAQLAGLNVGNRFRIGNLLFITPGDEQTGLAVFDIGNPAAPVLLDVLAGNYRQYTSAWQVWRHYLVLMIGDNTNGPQQNANTLIIDFSDPADLRLVGTIPYDDLPGRYVHFQDEFAFAGRFNRGVKYNMETRQVERVFSNPQHSFSDFQWIPLGHLLLVSGSEQNGSRSFLFTHQSNLDTRAPTIGYHLPADGATHQPLNSAIGLVINERLDATTVNEQNIQLREVDGPQLPAIIIHTSYDVVNVYPVSPLQADTSYELRIVAGGVRDLAGNGMAAQSFFFSTGDNVDTGQPPSITSMGSTPGSPVTSGSNIQFSASASDPAGHALEYSWTFGDGSASTSWSSSAAAQHSYAQPGQYTVQLQVRNAVGRSASATRVLVARHSGNAAAVSSSIVVHPARREVWSVNPDHGTVAVFDADALTRLAEISVGDHPAGLAVAADGRVWVVNRDDDSLSRINPVTRMVEHTLPLDYGDRPTAIVFAQGGTTGYVALSGSGEIARFSTASANVDARLAVGPQVYALSVSGDGGRLFASRFVSAAGAGQVWRIGLPAFSTVDSISLPIDSTTADSGTAGRGVPNFVAALASSPDGQRAFYAAKKDNVLRGQFREGSPLSFETTMRSLIGTLDGAGASEVSSARFDSDDASRPSALAWAPGASHLFVAFEGNHRVIALDPWNRREIARTEVGMTPQGLAFDPATSRLFVHNLLSRNVSVLDAADLVSQGTASLTELQRIASSSSEPLSAEVLAGKRIFYDAADTRMGQDGYFSCAACHLDGRQDGRVWDFTQLGEGLRNTTSLRGVAGMGHGRVHWSGNFDEIQDFENPMRALFGGLGFMDDADFNAGTRSEPLGDPKAGISAELDALAAYVDSLDRFDRSPFRSASGSLTADGMAGRTLFIQSGCADCHAGEAFSDSAWSRRHDVGTLSAGSGNRLGGALEALDTPTLRGVWDSAPYLHDGSAATLEALLTSGDAQQHTAGASLSAGQRSQLIAFLNQIDGSEPGMPAPPQLAISSPANGAQLAAGATLSLSITSSYSGIQQVEYLANGAVVASTSSAPWSAQWNGAAAGEQQRLQARVHHGNGRFITLSDEIRVSFSGLAAGAVFGDGFEE
ncbi:PKD domain-containing protein [Pseudomarimonas arenosa]|uniref:PKD domain-containing protein n=1 Tax=Pseudomarimonas arenosa TaxID=2774145 RepID=A0AAW3ZJK1_9GAMM|nr:PKD domain-containing protein [Pseudomarimonas arenosa]MBD8524636.1 PKD domain-containing protein [Pseudomarimonas arenosa]